MAADTIFFSCIIILSSIIALYNGINYYMVWRKKKDFNERINSGEFPHVIFSKLAKFKHGDHIKFRKNGMMGYKSCYYIGVDSEKNLVFTRNSPTGDNWENKPGYVTKINVVDFFLDYTIVGGTLWNKEKTEELKGVVDNVYNEVLGEIANESNNDNPIINIPLQDYDKNLIFRNNGRLRQKI